MVSDVTSDAVDPACLVSDGVCVFGCGGIDADCATTCGDGTCMGNGGELCGNCAADCMTQSAVCGNGACDPGEAAAGCIADCGPVPWPWTDEEAELLAMVNATRATGYACPSGAAPVAGALSATTFSPGSREWAWELAHQNTFMVGGTVCNGRTFSQRAMAGGYTAGVIVGGPAATSPAAVLGRILTDPVRCPEVLNGAYTRVDIGTAYDAYNSYVLIFD